jgi:16S rRNA (cytosine1402-N4)-methyltransferase
MRFNPEGDLTADIVINTYAEEDLARIFKDYGEERFARKIAREIVSRRKAEKFTNTVELAQFIEGVIPKKISKKSKSHPATKIFQAIRIEVNEELHVLEEALEAAIDIVKIGGRIVVISYHSLEDRVVKHFFKELERPAVSSAEESLYRSFGEPIVEKITKKPVVPSEHELHENPRSRSAKLRVYKKLKNKN